MKRPQEYNQETTAACCFNYAVRLRESPGDSIWQPLGLSQNLLIGIRFRLALKNPNEPVHNYHSQLQIVFKENSGLPT